MGTSLYIILVAEYCELLETECAFLTSLDMVQHMIKFDKNHMAKFFINHVVARFFLQSMELSLTSFVFTPLIKLTNNLNYPSVSSLSFFDNKKHRFFFYLNQNPTNT